MRRTRVSVPVSVGLVGAVALSLGFVVVSGPGGTAPGPPTPTVWLCKPGQSPDPCRSLLTTTMVQANGDRHVVRTKDAAHPAVDCFYVYPTVSPESGSNADLTIQPAETAVAFDQASRFSSVCRVYAPMYNQVTLAALAGRAPLTAASIEEANASVLASFEDYLAHDNHGRGIVFIGHSQGATVLIHLLQSEVDAKPDVRKLLVSAILLGGNVTVPIGKSVGGSFKHIPACRARRETGCVVAYSSYLTAPPADSIFGRVGQGVSLLSGQAADPRLQVLCVNPAALSGGSAPIAAYFPNGSGARLGAQGTQPTTATPWISYPGRYRARCESAAGATWLQVDPAPGDPRPTVTQALGPTWGLHLVDVNMTLGNLVSLVGEQARAFVARHR